MLPALAGAVLGIPGGIALFVAVDPISATPSRRSGSCSPSCAGTVLVVAGLTAIPARASARRPAAEILQSELA